MIYASLYHHPLSLVLFRTNSVLSSLQPKFYKSVIEDVLANVRELFLDDGFDEQVIQELRTTWERKLFDSRAMDHAIPQNSSNNGSSNNSTTNSSNSRNNNSNNSNHNKQSSSSSSSTSSTTASKSSEPSQLTSVITSNPNHIKNGSNSTAKSGKSRNIKSEPVESEEQIRGGGTTSTTTMVIPSTAAPVTHSNLYRASAIVTNNSSTLPAGMVATNANTANLLQVFHQQPPNIHQQQTAAQLSSASGQPMVSSRPTILTIIPSSNSSFSHFAPYTTTSSSSSSSPSSSSTSAFNNVISLAQSSAKNKSPYLQPQHLHHHNHRRIDPIDSSLNSLVEAAEARTKNRQSRLYHQQQQQLAASHFPMNLSGSNSSGNNNRQQQSHPHHIRAILGTQHGSNSSAGAQSGRLPVSQSQPHNPHSLNYASNILFNPNHHSTIGSSNPGNKVNCLPPPTFLSVFICTQA